MKKNEVMEVKENKTMKEKIADGIFSIVFGAGLVAALLGSEKCFEDLEDYQYKEHQNFYSEDEEEVAEEEKKYKRNRRVAAIMRPVCYYSVITFVTVVAGAIYAALFCKSEDEEE